MNSLFIKENKTIIKKTASLILLLLILYPISVNCFKRGNDFQSFYDIGVLAKNKANIYQPSPTTGMYVFYLPFFSLLMYPFSFLSVKLAAILFFYINFACLIWFIKCILIDFQEQIETKNRKWIILISSLLIFNFLSANFNLLQVNFLLFCSLYSGIRSLIYQRYIKAGFFFAIASFKWIPLMFAFYVIFMRNRKLIYSYFVFLGVFNSLPFFYFGFHAAVKQIKELVSLILFLRSDMIQNSSIVIQSLWGFLGRIFVSYDISNTGMMNITMLILIVISLIGLYYILEGREKTKYFFYASGCSFLILMLLFSPDARGAHLTFMFLPFIILAINAFNKNAKREKILLSFIFIVNILWGVDLVGRKMYEKAQQLSLFTMVLLLTFIYFLFEISKLPKIVKEQNSSILK